MTTDKKCRPKHKVAFAAESTDHIGGSGPRAGPPHPSAKSKGKVPSGYPVEGMTAPKQSRRRLRVVNNAGRTFRQIYFFQTHIHLTIRTDPAHS